MAQSKNQIANKLYGDRYEDLSPGEKAAVTRAYNKQSKTTKTVKPRARTSPSAYAVEIGRVGVNGTKKCLMVPGSTVADLINQSGYTIDKDKEGVNAQSDGSSVSLSTEVVDGEVYIIAPEIKSA